MARDVHLSLTALQISPRCVHRTDVLDEITPTTFRCVIRSIPLTPTDQPSDPDNDATFQAYSSFTTGYKPPTEYESLLVVASKARSGALKSYAWKEIREAVLVRTIHLIIYLHADLSNPSFSHINRISPPYRPTASFRSAGWPRVDSTKLLARSICILHF